MFTKRVLTVALLSSTCLIASFPALAAPCGSVISSNQANCTIETNGQNVTVNSGVTVTSGAGADGIEVIQNRGANDIINNGRINATIGANGIHVVPGGGGWGGGPGVHDIVNSQTGVIDASNSGIWIQRGANSITNDGRITATVNNGIHVSGSRVEGNVLNDTNGDINTLGNATNNSVGLLINDGSRVVGSVINRGILRGNQGIAVISPGTVVEGAITNSNQINTSGVAIKGRESTIGSISNETGASLISSNSHAIDLDGVTVQNGISNNGTISASSSGIRLFKTKVQSGGIILGSNSAITGNAGVDLQGGGGVGEGTEVTGDIANNGSIMASAYGIRLDSSRVSGDITNALGASITSDTHGIWLISNSNPAFTSRVDDIINYGTITTLNNVGDAILIENSSLTGRIDNQGTISSGHQGIRLDNNSTVAENIVNNGTITAVAEALRLGNASIAQGDIVNETGREMTGSAGVSISASQVDGTIINKGTITGTGTNSGDGGIVVSNASTIGAIRNETIDSSIIGNLDGIKITGSTASGGILNNGTISGLGSDGIHIGSASTFVGNIENNYIIFADSDGIDFGEGSVASSLTGNIINGANGVITANDNGIELGASGSRSTISGSIINNGIIDAQDNGIDTNNIEITGDIINNNRIEGGDFGIYMQDTQVGGVLTNALGAYIGGSDHAISINSPTTRLTINNYGELDGALRIEGATLNFEEGSIVSGPIGGNGGILNINTNYASNHEFGALDGTLDEINLASGKTFTSQRGSNTLIDTLVFNNNGTFKLIGNSGSSVVATVFGDYNQSTNGLFSFDAQLPTVHSALNIGGTGTFAADTGIHVNIIGNEFDFANQAIIENVITAGTLNATTFTVTDSSYLYNFNSIVNGNSVDLQSSSDPTRSIGGAVNGSGSGLGNSPISGAATVIDDIIAAGPVGDMQNIVNALGTLGSAAEIQDAVRQTLPVLTGGSSMVILQTANVTGQIVQARQDQNSGLSSGDDLITSGNLWMKPFGTWSDQGFDDDVVGYDADTYGIMIGADNTVSDSWRVGVAGAYANTDVKSKDSLNDLGVDSYQATLYGSYVIDPKTELNFQVDAGYNGNESERIINFGGLDRTAKGDFDSYSGHLGAGIGHVIALADDTTITPMARVDYNIIYNESYTETDAGALNLTVRSQTTDQLIPMASAKLNHDLGDHVSFSANAGVGYDVLNDRNSVTANYTGGGGAFVTTGLEPSPWVVRSGAGLTYDLGEDYDLSVRYDREDRGEFKAQTVSARLRTEF